MEQLQMVLLVGVDLELLQMLLPAFVVLHRVCVSLLLVLLVVPSIVGHIQLGFTNVDSKICDKCSTYLSLCASIPSQQHNLTSIYNVLCF